MTSAIWLVHTDNSFYSTPPVDGVSAVGYGKRNADVVRIEDESGHVLYEREAVGYQLTVASLEIDDGIFIIRTDDGTSINIAADVVTIFNAKKKLPARRILVSHDLIMKALAEYAP